MPDPDFVDELAEVFGLAAACSPASSRREGAGMLKTMSGEQEDSSSPHEGRAGT